jgi:hypothetical protein
MMKMKIARRSDVLLLLIPVAVGLMWDFGRPADAARAPRLAAQPSPVSQAPPARPAEPLSFRRLWQAQTRGSVSVTLLGFYRGYPIQEDGNSRSGVAVAYLVEYLGDEPVGPTSRRLPEWTTSDAHNVLAPRVLIQAIDYDVVKNCRPEDRPPAGEGLVQGDCRYLQRPGSPGY